MLNYPVRQNLSPLSDDEQQKNIMIMRLVAPIYFGVFIIGTVPGEYASPMLGGLG